MDSLGIDIGGTSVKAARLSADGTLSLGASESYERPTPGEIARAVREAAEPLARGVGAVGLCVPGVLDERTRTVAANTNMPGLIGVEVDRLLADALGATPPPRLTSDAHAAAYDFFVTQRPVGRLLAISLGTGVGAAVLDDGTLLRVTGPSSGHIGQMDVRGDDPDPPAGPAGERGSLESYLGLPALRARFGAVTPATLAALDVTDPAIVALARAIRVCHAIYRPHAVALLGGLGLGLRHLLAPLREVCVAGLTPLARPGWTLITGVSAHHAAAGSARLAAKNTNGLRTSSRESR